MVQTVNLSAMENEAIDSILNHMVGECYQLEDYKDDEYEVSDYHSNNSLCEDEMKDICQEIQTTGDFFDTVNDLLYLY